MRPRTRSTRTYVASASDSRWYVVDSFAGTSSSFWALYSPSKMTLRPKNLVTWVKDFEIESESVGVADARGDFRGEGAGLRRLAPQSHLKPRRLGFDARAAIVHASPTANIESPYGPTVRMHASTSIPPSDFDLGAATSSSQSHLGSTPAAATTASTSIVVPSLSVKTLTPVSASLRASTYATHFSAREASCG